MRSRVCHSYRANDFLGGRRPQRFVVVTAGSLPDGGSLRLVDRVKRNYLLLDLHRHVRDDVFVEPGVMLLLRLPDLGDAKALVVFIGDMEYEPRLRLDLLDQRRRNSVVVRPSHPLWAVPNQDSHSVLLCWMSTAAPLHIPSGCARSTRMATAPLAAYFSRERVELRRCFGGSSARTATRTPARTRAAGCRSR